MFFWVKWVCYVGIWFSLVSVLENVKTEELQVVFFEKKKSESKNFQFWVFQNSKKLQIQWKNKQRIVGSRQFFDYFYF